MPRETRSDLPDGLQSDCAVAANPPINPSVMVPISASDSNPSALREIFLRHNPNRNRLRLAHYGLILWGIVGDNPALAPTNLKKAKT